MPTSSDPTRHATRRGARERLRAHAEAGDRATLPAFGSTLRPDRASRTTTDDPARMGRAAGRDRAGIGAVAGGAVWANAERPPTALTWVDAAAVAEGAVPAGAAPALFAGARLVPEWLRLRVLVPLVVVLAVCGSYAAATLLWPLDAVAPTVEAVPVPIADAPEAALAWPDTGSAAVAVQGMAPAASTAAASEIASISKVASVLMVLDELPLALGEQGPRFDFTLQDSRDYWGYRISDQSALDVPVGGSLTEYQMLQGILLGSANNYIDRLSDELWGSDTAFSQASQRWLRDRGLDGITLRSPSGFDEGNVATPEALVRLGELAMANPVFAEIVGTRSAEIPGVGVVTNTNRMLADAGVVGVKTGTLKHWHLLTAKDVAVGDTTVRLFAAVLGQDDGDQRVENTRRLLADVESTLIASPPAVPAGTVVGDVVTLWGERVQVRADADAGVVRWNAATATATTTFSLGEDHEKGARIGTLTVQGPVDTATSSVSLAGDIAAPSAWWRLTHPLELFDLDRD